MSKPPSIGEVATISKLFLKFCPKIPAAFLILTVFVGSTLSVRAEDDPQKSIPRTIETLDDRSFSDCELVRAEPDAILIRHSKGIARLSFSILNEHLKNAFQYDPAKAFKAATANYKKEQILRKWRFREEETVRAMREHEEKLATVKSSWIPAEATVIRTNDKGIYVAAKRIVRNCASGKILKQFGPACIFLPENSPELRPGSLWKGYICPHPDDTVLDLNGEMFTVPFHQAWTIGYQNTGGT